MNTRTMNKMFLIVFKEEEREVIVTSRFVIVDVDAFELEIRITMICASWIDTMFIGNNFPKLGKNHVDGKDLFSGV